MTNPQENIFADPNAFHAKLNEITAAVEGTQEQSPQQQYQPIEQAPIPSQPTHEPVGERIDDELAPLNGNESNEDGEINSEQEFVSANEPVKNSHMIPKSRLDKEIESRKASDKQLQEEREARIRLETQMQMYMEMQKNQAPQVAAKEEPYVDPLDPDAFNYTNKRFNELEHKLTQALQTQEQKTREMQFYNQLNAQEFAFERANPDYKEAIEYVRNIELAVAKNLVGDDATAAKLVAEKLQNSIMFALNNGKNAPETVYNMATTYGYKKPQANKVDQVNGHANLDNINKNTGRTANAAHLGNRATGQFVPKDIRSTFIKGDPKKGVDPDAFHEVLKQFTGTVNQ